MLFVSVYLLLIGFFGERLLAVRQCGYLTNGKEQFDQGLQLLAKIQHDRSQ